MSRISVVNFCPNCMTKLFSAERALEIGEAVQDVKDKEFSSVKRLFAESGVARFGVFIPGEGPDALLFERRIHFYPICSACAHLMGTTEFEEKCEFNIVMQRRYGWRMKGVADG